MTEHDKKMGEELLKEPFILKHPEWVKELELMMKLGVKAEIQVGSYLSIAYCPRSAVCLRSTPQWPLLNSNSHLAPPW
jgi:hypothetical protein